MTCNFELPADRVLGGLASRAIEERLGDLVRRYVQQRSWGLARAVVRHMEALCLHPDYDGDPHPALCLSPPGSALALAIPGSEPGY